jgi:hypothetical protein
MPRVTGNRTPRRVQWASAIDKDGFARRNHENGPESDAASAHELDEAGFDVRAAPVESNALLPTQSFSTASCLPNAYSRS